MRYLLALGLTLPLLGSTSANASIINARFRSEGEPSFDRFTTIPEDFSGATIPVGAVSLSPGDTGWVLDGPYQLEITVSGIDTGGPWASLSLFGRVEGAFTRDSENPSQIRGGFEAYFDEFRINSKGPDHWFPDRLIQSLEGVRVTGEVIGGDRNILAIDVHMGEIPEPTSIAVLLVGLGGYLAHRRYAASRRAA